MVSRGKEVVGLEVSACVGGSTCCSNAGENEVSSGVVSKGCAMVEKAFCAGSSCRSRGHVYVELFGNWIVKKNSRSILRASAVLMTRRTRPTRYDTTL